MLLTYTELCDLVANGVIKNVAPEQINGASIDVTLGNLLLVEAVNTPVLRKTVRLAARPREGIAFEEYDMGESGGYEMRPGEFLLAETQQEFALPLDIAPEFKLKSSIARNGLNHALAGWGDPGWHGSKLTLELMNATRAHWLVIEPGMPIGQIIFWRGTPVPVDKSYAARGQYNNDARVTASKGVR